MRIALYLKHFPAEGAPLVGGTATAVDGLAYGLAQNGAEVTVLCEGSARRSRRSPRGYGVEAFANGRRYRTFGIAPELGRFAAARFGGGRGICLLNGMFHPSCFALGRALRAAHVPYVAIPHDPYDPSVFLANPHLKWPYWYLFERRHLRQAAAVQVLDRRHGAHLRRLGIEVPVIETPNGVSGSGGAPAWDEGGGAPKIVFLGRLDAYNKGLDVLLEAFARVARTFDARLTLQGPDWGDRAKLEKRAAALAMDGKVAFRGPDYGRGAVEILGEHDVFCLPSRFEGFGLAALEAMLAARVLLVSERAGIAAHVVASGAGMTVPPTAEGVAAGLIALLARRAQWREMGARARAYVLERLQWKDIAAAALEHYDRLLH
jgi:glycosyltransferase involved in cell wall biosynthesis